MFNLWKSAKQQTDQILFQKMYGSWKTGLQRVPCLWEKFKEWARSLKTCCSPECSSIHRKMLYSSGTLTDIHKVREKMFELSESLDASERWGTKHWVIQSPSGKVYEIDNLFNFIKNNPELFDGTPRQAYDGFSKIKASMEGKRKNPSSGWKGWTLVSYSENKNAYIGKKKKGGGKQTHRNGFLLCNLPLTSHSKLCKITFSSFFSAT